MLITRNHFKFNDIDKFKVNKQKKNNKKTLINGVIFVSAKVDFLAKKITTERDCIQ